MMAESDMLAAKLKMEGEKVITFLANLSEHQWNIDVFTEDNRWTIRSVLAHLMTTERAFLRLFTQVLHPEFIAEAEAAGEKKALNSFKWAWEVEKEHEQIFQQVIADMGADIAGLEIWVCPVCGHTHLGVRPEKCPVCGTPGERSELIA